MGRSEKCGFLTLIKNVTAAWDQLTSSNELQLFICLDFDFMQRRSLKYLYKSALLPNSETLQKDVNNAAERLHRRLERLDVNGLEISDYGKTYFGKQLVDIGGTLQRYAYILAWSFESHTTPRERFVFIDYGGGPGILSLLAKELGIGTVIYNDIYDVSCRDSKVVGQIVGNEADFYVEGDADDLIGFLRKASISCDAIASYDVIEHIYDIENFMTEICSLSETPYNIVMSSGANPYNPIIKKRIVRQQLEVEYKDRKKEWGHKERDCLRAYFKARKEIISASGHELSDLEVDRLARATRGLTELEIKSWVEKWVRTGELPVGLNHRTNTCDPYTGNWAEHLMDVHQLASILSHGGFEVDVKAGYYGQTSNDFRKRLLARILNPLITVLGPKGLMLSPFYTIYGRKLKSGSHKLV